MPVSGAMTRAVTTAVQATASAHRCEEAADATVAASAVGASTRRAVRPMGWGTSVAARPTAQPAHSPSDARVRGAWSQPRRPAARLGPAVKGSATHQARRSHGKRRCRADGNTATQATGPLFESTVTGSEDPPLAVLAVLNLR